MVQYTLPAGMRYATLEEREEFYSKEFALEKVAGWFGKELVNTRFAVIIGRHTGIYPQKYKQDSKITVVIDEYQSLEDVRLQILEFLPEAVYYDRNVYDSAGRIVGQELAFDLDPENVTCPIHGSLADKMKRGQGLSFCELELDMVKQQAKELLDFLEGRFSRIKVVYSGRGFHLHVFDHQAYILNAGERVDLARQAKQAGFQIDEWVTSGEFRLIRLPYSLNGLVSRIVLPLSQQELEGFDAIHDERCLPRFLGEPATF